MSEHINTLFGCILAAGLPFAFWPLYQPADTDFLLQQIQNLVCAETHSSWPKLLHNKRKSEKSSWHDLQLLWDNPERIPPDANYKLLSPE
jgi:hypothetical protein